MANRIKGLTVEIDGSTTGLDKALKDVNSTIRNTLTQLKDVQRLLKLDPSNTELLSQKQRLLKDAIVPQGTAAVKGAASYENAAATAKPFAAEASKAAVTGGLKKAGLSTLVKVTIGVSSLALVTGGVAGARIIGNRSPQVEIQAQDSSASSRSNANDVTEDQSHPDRAEEDDLSGAVSASGTVQSETQKTPEEQYNDLLNKYVDFFAGEIPYNETGIRR